ncbi:MAG: ribonuclease P protein component [Chlorobium sp.]
MTDENKLLLHVLNKLHVHTLRKHEILRKKQQISLLFRDGKSVRGDFLKIVYVFLDPESNSAPGCPVILFAVSKKTVPSSVHRNRVKRMMKEAYRLEKTSEEHKVFFSHEESTARLLCIAFLYTGRRKTIPGLEDFRPEVKRLLQHITPFLKE